MSEDQELITEWDDYVCKCGFTVKLVWLADDPNMDYAHNLIMLHEMECGL